MTIHAVPFGEGFTYDEQADEAIQANTIGLLDLVEWEQIGRRFLVMTKRSGRNSKKRQRIASKGRFVNGV